MSDRTALCGLHAGLLGFIFLKTGRYGTSRHTLHMLIFLHSQSSPSSHRYSQLWLISRFFVNQNPNSRWRILAVNLDTEKDTEDKKVMTTKTHVKKLHFSVSRFEKNSFELSTKGPSYNWQCSRLCWTFLFQGHRYKLSRFTAKTRLSPDREFLKCSS